ncbi:MAG: ATP-dependent helicase, partial [Actinobacteria bacterium]|nr:ATP-dependent helicase [Actinomycetota bacterium]
TLPGVTLSTLHGAKGLEWEKVYLVGASETTLPWKGESLEEERRLFYVGITRAKETLVLSYAGKPSPFLREAGLIEGDK